MTETTLVKARPPGVGPPEAGQRAVQDARDVELSLAEPDRFGVIFDRYFAEIHGYAARRLGRDAAGLVINPASGLPIAQELRYVRLPAGRHWSAPGGLFSYEIFGTPHWTGALPRRNPNGR